MIQNPYLLHYPPPQHKRALNKEQIWEKPLTAWQVNPNIEATKRETIQPTLKNVNWRTKNNIIQGNRPGL